MGEKSFFSRIVFSPTSWGLLLGSIYIVAIWQDYAPSQQLSLRVLLIDFLINHFIWHFFAFIFLLFFWTFFFAQFILPVRTNKNRGKIFERLLTRMLRGESGPALLVRDGQLVESEGESKKSGPGVIVLDSASAVVMKKFGKYTQVSGPGVLFTDKGETIAEQPVPLQKLIDTSGPRERENPFTPKADHQSPEEFQSIQERRFATRAMTRDGIEIVPNISVVFKIDAKPARGNEAGSRFGYNEESVRKAIWHTSVDISNDRGKTISWTKLPMNIAVDVWREYLAKYRFEELFQATQDVPLIEEPEPPPHEPQISSSRTPHYEYRLRGIICDFLLFINAGFAILLDRIEQRLSPPIQDEEKSIEEPPPPSTKRITPEKETALQSIQRHINERLKNEEYVPLDRYGKPQKNSKRKSLEYEFLTKERGIRIIAVSIKNLRFTSKLEIDLINNWQNSWLKNAKDEQSYIEKHKKVRENKGRELALLGYAEALSKEINREQLGSSREALQRLLRVTRREIIRNPQLLKEAEKEIDNITDLIQWVDKGGESDAAR